MFRGSTLASIYGGQKEWTVLIALQNLIKLWIKQKRSARRKYITLQRKTHYKDEGHHFKTFVRKRKEGETYCQLVFHGFHRTITVAIACLLLPKLCPPIACKNVASLFSTSMRFVAYNFASTLLNERLPFVPTERKDNAKKRFLKAMVTNVATENV